MEDGSVVRLPGHDLVKTFPLDFVEHELHQVQFDWLLDEHDVGVRQDWSGRENTHQRMMAGGAAASSYSRNNLLALRNTLLITD